MHHALTIPPYGELADPAALVEIAVAAEAAGWDAVFLWDHVLRRPNDPQETADPWVAMAAMAVATERIRLGRAARYDGLYPIDVSEADLRAMLDVVVEVRGSLDGFDAIVRPTGELPYRLLEEFGVTWAIAGPAPGDPTSFDQARTPPSELFGSA